MRPTLTGIERAAEEAATAPSPREHAGRLRALLVRELEHGARELSQTRSGYEAPVVAAVAPAERGVLAVTPADATLRADPDAAGERTMVFLAALIAAMVEATADDRDPRPSLTAGAFDDRLALHLPGDPAGAELVPMAFDEQLRGIDRLRARVVVVPAEALADVEDLKAPIGPTHPLRVAEDLARRGGGPADSAALADHAELLRAAAGEDVGLGRPHTDPDPARRIARRILQRLDGMGKWGGYHTEFSNLSRGFVGNDRALAEAVGEALLEAGLLAEKTSVGQRHVFLNPRRVAEVRALIERGETPPALALPTTD